MRRLTDIEENLINTREYSVDWNEEFDEAYNRTQRPELIEQELEMRFDDSVEYDTVEDLGGINVYFKEDKLIAFYDYEQFVGTYF
tara:strand:- start:918 stop:1172 length:255 start_codon:yes stop_codon:yes gene_type:complete